MVLDASNIGKLALLLQPNRDLMTSRYSELNQRYIWKSEISFLLDCVEDEDVGSSSEIHGYSSVHLHELSNEGVRSDLVGQGVCQRCGHPTKQNEADCNCDGFKDTFEPGT